MHKEIKHRLNSGNACYYALQGLLSSQLLSKNIKLKIYKTAILPVILDGCETNGLSRSTLHRALLVVILLTSIYGIKNFTKRNALGGVNCNYFHEWIFGLPLNLKQF